MAAFINTNISSLNAQRNLNASQGALQTSLQRLSSGLRINSAKDDAAGLAIADRFTTQIRGLNQAVRNANDGISLSQTAEGALGEMGNNLQRIRELAVQAANSTNSDSDRKAINEEVQQRLAELDRTSSQTSFNGQKILDGSFGNAKFQIGANVGETIDIDLNTSMRNSSMGKIAGGTSTVFGASATKGEVTTGAISAFDFRAASAATGGSYTMSPTTMQFSSASSAGSGGKLAVTGLTQTDFNNGLASAVKASNTQTFTGSADFSGAGDLAQFDVTIGGTTVGVTLNSDYTNAAGVAAAIETQLNNGVGDGTQITVTESGGKFKIEADTALTTDAISVSNIDANGTAHGFADSTGTKGAAAGATASNASFKVDGTTITLNQTYANQAAVAAAIQTQLQGTPATANYSVSTGAAGEFTITNNTIGSAAVAITANDDEIGGGWVGSAGTATAGVAAVSNKDAKFLVDGQSVTLAGTFTDFDDMAEGLEDAIQGLGGDYAAYEVTNNAGALTITKGGTDQSAVAITADPSATANQSANATAAGLLAGTGATGNAAITSSNASFKVDGTTITLDSNYTNATGLANAIKAQLQASASTSTYDAVVDGSGIKITGTNSTTAVAISDLSGSAATSGFAAMTGTGGVSAGSLNLASFSIKAGSNKQVDLSGQYANGQALVDAINSKVSGVSASLDGGKLKLTSAFDITLGGSSATASAAAGGLGFAATTISADQGALSASNTLTTDAANETIQRIDSALASVNSLRSSFGAVQNRFESVISNLSSTSENLSAARSRIQDADFASETATLTRGQILQQAGTAMLAQANSLPNGVMALLRG